MALSGLLAAPQAPPTPLAHQVLLLLLIPGTITPPTPPPAPNQEAHSLLLLTFHIFSVSKFCGFHFLEFANPPQQ